MNYAVSTVRLITKFYRMILAWSTVFDSSNIFKRFIQEMGRRAIVWRH